MNEDELAELKRQETDLLVEIKFEGRCGKNCPWITYCVVAGCFMGTGSFIYASNYVQVLHVVIELVQWMGG